MRPAFHLEIELRVQARRGAAGGASTSAAAVPASASREAIAALVMDILDRELPAAGLELRSLRCGPAGPAENPAPSPGAYLGTWESGEFSVVIAGSNEEAAARLERRSGMRPATVELLESYAG